MKFLVKSLLFLSTSVLSAAALASEPQSAQSDFKFLCRVGDNAPILMQAASGTEQSLVKETGLEISFAFQDVVPGFTTVPMIYLRAKSGEISWITQTPLLGSSGSVNVVVQRPGGDRRVLCMAAKGPLPEDLGSLSN